MLAAVPARAVAQCPMCKEALTNDGEAGGAAPKNGEPVSGLARGFFWSILLMLAMPFTLAGAIVAMVYRAATSPAAVVPVSGAEAGSPPDVPLPSDPAVSPLPTSASGA